MKVHVFWLYTICWLRICKMESINERFFFCHSDCICYLFAYLCMKMNILPWIKVLIFAYFLLIHMSLNNNQYSWFFYLPIRTHFVNQVFLHRLEQRLALQGWYHIEACHKTLFHHRWGIFVCEYSKVSLMHSSRYR